MVLAKFNLISGSTTYYSCIKSAVVVNWEANPVLRYSMYSGKKNYLEHKIYYVKSLVLLRAKTT